MKLKFRRKDAPQKQIDLACTILASVAKASISEFLASVHIRNFLVQSKY